MKHSKCVSRKQLYLILKKKKTLWENYEYNFGFTGRVMEVFFGSVTIQRSPIWSKAEPWSIGPGTPALNHCAVHEVNAYAS